MRLEKRSMSEEIEGLYISYRTLKSAMLGILARSLSEMLEA